MEKYKVGEDVVYNNHRWTIESIERVKMHGINPETGARIVEVSVKYRLARLRRTPSCVFELVWTMAPEEQIENVPHELTAKEYAEKLRAVFGVKLEAVDNFEDLDICYGVNCRECPFDQKRLKAAGYHGNCTALMVYHPELAVKLMDEWQAEKNKPKGKTYREDFFEKFPNADRTAAGLPMPCRNKLYFAAAPCSANSRYNCDDCWNEVMPR